MSNADENREPELELNKETLQDLDVGANAAAVKGGGLEAGYTLPTLGGQAPLAIGDFMRPTIKTVVASAPCG